MRSAEVSDYWRAITKSPSRPNYLGTFSYKNLAGLVDSVIAFESPITAICGLSGSGKTALLRAIWATLDWTSAVKHFEVRNRLAGSQLEASLTIKGNVEKISVDVESHSPCNNPKPCLDVLHFDPSIVAGSLQKTFCEIRGLDVLLDAYEPIELNAEEIRLIGFISKKNYKTIKIYEIDEFDDERILPFVQIEDEIFKYDTRTMSLGEISIMLCFWELRRAAEGTIFLAEEPETYISPASQSALMDFLANICVKKKMMMIITTHSPQMVARLDPIQVKFLFRRHNGGASFASPKQHGKMLQTVGLDKPVNIFLAVEDRAAREFAKLLIARLDYALYTQIDVIDVAGEAEITKIRRVIPKGLRCFSVLGVYDGDMRERISDSADHWPVIFLPGSTAVEHSFQELTRTHPTVFAEKLARSEEDFETALSSTHGSDAHDWFESLARSCGLSYEQMMMAAFECWYSVEGNRLEASRFIEDVKRAANRTA